MTDEFGKSGDDQTGQDEGNNFGQNTEGKTNPDSGSQGIDQQEYEALRKRDENAQALIPRLESENKELRDKYAELEAKLANATTIDDALARIANQGDGQTQQGVDRTDVAQVVEEILGQHQTATMQKDNWNTVQDALSKEYGDWTTADAKVQERAKELDISIEDATSMAKVNPKAFMQLFVPQQDSSNKQAGSSTGTGEMGQKGVSSQSGDVRDKAWWNKMRRENPNKYWSVEMQAQMRRDLFSE